MVADLSSGNLKDTTSTCLGMTFPHVEPASSKLIESIGFQSCDPFKSPVSKYHKDNLPHIQVPGVTYFITYRTDNFRVLSSKARKCALDAILFWDNKRCKVFTAVVMPDHVHVIARPLQKVVGWQDAGSTTKDCSRQDVRLYYHY